MTIELALLIIACLFFCMAALGVTARLNLVALGLAIWVFAAILRGLR